MVALYAKKLSSSISLKIFSFLSPLPWAVDRIWTGDLRLTMALLYQLSYNGFLSISTDSVTNIFLISDYPVKKEYSERLLTPLIKSNQYSESIILIFVGREGFEPPKPEGDRFTVCCDRPLHHRRKCERAFHSPVSRRGNEALAHSNTFFTPIQTHLIPPPSPILAPSSLPASFPLE